MRSHLENMFAAYSIPVASYPERIKMLRTIILQLIAFYFQNLNAEAQNILKNANGQNQITSEMIERSDGFFNYLMLGFFLKNPQSYKICADFGRRLNSVNLKIDTKMVPCINESLLIEFPDWFNLQHSDGAEIKCVFIHQLNEDHPDERAMQLLTRMHYNRLAKDKRSELRTLLMAFPDYKDGVLTLSDSFIFIDLFKDASFDECVEYKFTEGFIVSKSIEKFQYCFYRV